jgi:hypothetical protein
MPSRQTRHAFTFAASMASQQVRRLFANDLQLHLGGTAPFVNAVSRAIAF